MQIQGHRRTSLHLKARLDKSEIDLDIIRLGRFLERHDNRMVLASGGGEGVRMAEAWKLEHEVVALDRTGLLSGWRSRSRLGDLIERRRPAVIHVHDLPALNAAAPFRSGSRGLIASLDCSPDTVQALTPNLMEHCDRLVVASHYEADALIEERTVPSAKIRVIRPIIDSRELDPKGVSGRRIGTLAERWRLEVGRKVILMPAPVRPGQGHLALIEALGHLERRDFHLVMLGEHETGDGFARQIEARGEVLGLGDCLRFMNECPDRAAAYGLADLIVMLPEEAHPLPRAALEAQAMGKPVILSAVGAAHEFVMPASTGWLVAKDDAAELDWALALALDLTSEVRERVAERARRFIEAEFSVEQAGEKLLGVYGELAQPASI